MDGQENLNAGTPPPAHCVRLFGVKLTDFSTPNHASIQMGFMRKSVSTGNLALKGFNTLQRHSDCVQPHTEHGLANPRSDTTAVMHSSPQQGYASDGLMQSSSMSLRERKKGVAWTEDEHRLFLAGLQKLGKGDWRGISRNFVTSRTPTQVASHAQKYFLRQGNLNKRKRRPSLFDMINSNMVPGTNVIGEDSQFSRATELVRPPLELGLQQVTASSSSLQDSSSGYRKFPSSRTPCVSSDLCLGRSHWRQWRELADENVSAALSRSGKRDSMMDALPPCQLLSSKRILGLDDVAGTDCRSKSICTISSSSSSSRSISSGPSLCRIDEMSELSSLSLSLSLGPPMSVEAPELALKLEQPVTSRLSVNPSAMSEIKEVMLTAGAGTVVGNASKVASMANVIKVV